MKTLKTIDRVLKDNWYTREEISVYREMWVTNWMGSKWWIKFTKELSKLPWFNNKKWKQLLKDMDLVSDIHDIRFYVWWWLFGFLRANWKFGVNIIALFHWTTPMGRILLFTTLFIVLTLVGWINFTWNKIL